MEPKIVGTVMFLAALTCPVPAEGGDEGPETVGR